MKKILMIAATSAFLISGFTATKAIADNYTKWCKSCHQINKDGVGPSFKTIQAAYGDPATLAKAWESGFAVEDRAIAGNPCNPYFKKYHKKAKVMTAQYKKLIKKAAERGRITYQSLAEEVFAK
jgi:cytochrome c551/c552